MTLDFLVELSDTLVELSRTELAGTTVTSSSSVAGALDTSATFIVLVNEGARYPAAWRASRPGADNDSSDLRSCTCTREVTASGKFEAKQSHESFLKHRLDVGGVGLARV